MSSVLSLQPTGLTSLNKEEMRLKGGGIEGSMINLSQTLVLEYSHTFPFCWVILAMVLFSRPMQMLIRTMITITFKMKLNQEKIFFIIYLKSRPENEAKIPWDLFLSITRFENEIFY